MIIITKWDDYHIGFVKRPERIIIGKGSMSKNGEFKYKDRSDDRTEEVLLSAMSLLKYKNDKRNDARGYYGVELNNIGKILFIEDGYDFVVYKKGEL